MFVFHWRMNEVGGETKDVFWLKAKVHKTCIPAYKWAKHSLFFPRSGESGAFYVRLTNGIICSRAPDILKTLWECRWCGWDLSAGIPVEFFCRQCRCVGVYGHSNFLLQRQRLALKKKINKAILSIFIIRCFEIYGVVRSKQYNTGKDRREHLSIAHE